MIRKILTAAVLMASSTSMHAQTSVTEAPSTKQDTAAEVKSASPVITGYGDVYYRYDFQKQASNNKTSFTNSHNSFEVNMASVKLEHTIGKVGMVADLGFGRRAEEFSYNDANTRFAIKQLFLSYAVSDHIKFTAGSWATHVGYELVDPIANRNYSMSYMFSYGPFFHTGVKTDLTFGKHNFMVGVSNPTDFKTTTSKHKYLLAQYSTGSESGKVKGYLNYVGGSSSDTTSMRQVDAVITATVSDKFSLGYNGTIANYKMKPVGKTSTSSKWWGSALYLNVDPVSWFGLTLRSEYFSDDDMSTMVFSPALKGGNIFANTLSANFKIASLTLIPELRFEKASEEIYLRSSGQGTKNAASFLMAAVYKF